MPYRSFELDHGGVDPDPELNRMEEEGWTPVQVIPGYSTYDAETKQQVLWRPQLVFHREKDKPKGVFGVVSD